ncbi:MAG TPA: beta-L-arabinofuranosidase domain-containing protein, partial [Methylococcales bacterium]
MSNAYIGKIAAVIVSLCMTFFFNKELIAREIPTKTDLPANVAAVAFDRSNDVTYQFSGYLNDYLEGVSGWAKSAPERNQGMLDMLSDRERQPYRYLMPWGGEFVGKYLVGAAELYRLNKDPQLKKVIDSFVDKLQQLQAKNGYLGPWPEKYELTCDVPKDAFCGWADVTWDLWGHYHLMLGLTLWYQDTGNTKALDVGCKIGDMLCDKYLGKVGVMAKLKDSYTNLSPGHSLFLLYKATNNKRYLDLAKQIIEEEFPRSVNHVNFALSGKEFYQNPFHGAVRWENAHELLGIAEMYWLTGEKKYRTAFEHIWWSIVKSDRYNTGTFASGEGVRGSPYNKLSKETCCAVAWEAMGVEMLRMTGNSVVADELELTFLNAVLAYQKRNGEWCTYDTPMDGIRFTRT